MHEALFSYFSGEMRAVSNALSRYLSFKSAACEPQSSQTLNISSPLFAPFDLPVRHRGTEKLRCFFFLHEAAAGGFVPWMEMRIAEYSLCPPGTKFSV